MTLSELKIYIFIAIFIVVLFYIFSFRKFSIEMPHYDIIIDITNKRNVQYNDLIEQYLIDNKELDLDKIYYSFCNAWRNKCEEYINKSFLWKKYKQKCYKDLNNIIRPKEYPFFRISFIRNKTKYKQINNNRYSYIGETLDRKCAFSLEEFKEIRLKLKSINFQTTVSKYNSKEQRKLLTRQLRRKIILRDNWTCQICGKYMPDEVGLHVDHIISVKDGGKTIEGNLRVLCDKCNLSKGKKSDYFIL